MFTLLPVGLGFSPAAIAQVAPPYLKSATFYISVDGWADIWLNGIPIRESQPSTPESKGFQTIQCLPKHLCYFQNENILAIENANAFNSQPPLRGQIGIAYVLKLRFSDGTERTLSSNDRTDHKSYYLPGREMGEPEDWHRMSFNDVNWPPPYAIGTTVPGVALLTDPENRQEIQFLSASGMTPKAEYPGERHLYRQKFYLNIGPNPLCAPEKNWAQEKPRAEVRAMLPKPTPKTQPVLTTPTFTSFPIDTPIPKPVYTWKPILTPTATTIPSPAPAWTPVLPPTASPTFTSVPIGVVRPSPTPTISPVPARTFQIRRKFKKPTPTPIPKFGVSSRAELVEKAAPPVAAKASTPTPTSGVTPAPVANQAQTIVFENQPANIYISFADGPGVYRLEVVDASGSHLRNLFEKHVVAQPDDWVEWDGKDDSGREMPTGQYTVLYTKDGRALNKLVLVKTADP